MDKKKINIIILVIFCVLLIVIGLIICVDLFNNNHNANNLSNENISNDLIEKDDEENNIIDSGVNVENSDDEVTDNIQNNYSEDDVVSYFENMEYELTNGTSFKEKFKEYFVTIVDFIFYNKEIKGYTFGELTGTAKAKIVAMALKMDSKIDEFVPEYKENISNTTGKIYTDIKEKLIVSYMDISTAICKDNSNECDKVKDIFGDVKDYCKIGWNFIKELFKSGSAKIKDWYEIYSGK